MKLTYLGTAAAEGFPALFCNCKHCIEARRLKGKNIRTRSQTLINDDLLIDFSQDTYHHFLQNGIEGDKIKYLFITHGHQDHFYRSDLFIRKRGYAHNLREPILKMFASRKTLELLEKLPENIEINTIEAYQTVELDGYRVTALPAKHMPGGEALFYVIEGDKTILYAHDTGYFYEEVFSFIENKGWRFDMISLDCTNIEISISDDGNHMGLPNNERVISRLADIGAINEKTVKYVNHFSHNGNPIHHLLEEKAKKIGCLVSYDGCSVEL